jgi:hypothetical protein
LVAGPGSFGVEGVVLIGSDGSDARGRGRGPRAAGQDTCAT